MMPAAVKMAAVFLIVRFASAYSRCAWRYSRWHQDPARRAARVELSRSRADRRTVGRTGVCSIFPCSSTAPRSSPTRPYQPGHSDVWGEAMSALIEQVKQAVPGRAGRSRSRRSVSCFAECCRRPGSTQRASGPADRAVEPGSRDGRAGNVHRSPTRRPLGICLADPRVSAAVILAVDDGRRHPVEQYRVHSVPAASSFPPVWSGTRRKASWSRVPPPASWRRKPGYRAATMAVLGRFHPRPA